MSSAHFHAPACRDLFVELPPEDALVARGDVVGHLVMSMYGTRDAAHNWEAAYSEYLAQLGFRRGQASSRHYYHPTSKVRILVHGDDFVAVGYEDRLVGLGGGDDEAFSMRRSDNWAEGGTPEGAEGAGPDDSDGA